MTRQQYLEKVESVFSDSSKFTKLPNNPLKQDLKDFRKLLNEMKPHMTKQQFYRLDPKQSLKKGYLKIKIHKDVGQKDL